MDVLVLEPASPLPESGRSSPSPTASPEFEFWMVGKNPGSFPSPALLTADELFSDGIVLPLHTFQPPPPNADEDDEEADEEAEEDADDDKDKEPCQGDCDFPAQPLAESCSVAAPDLPAVTFKWKDIFKATGDAKDRGGKKNERRVSSVSGSSELININIWPFSRSRSAGHSGSNAGAGISSKAKASVPNANNTTCAVAATANAAVSSAAPAGRKVSSAPCSRSNSRGETSGPAAPTVAIAAAAEKAAAQAGAVPNTSLLRRWVPGGQGRTGAAANGIRLGRASPVWQLRRNKLQQAAAAAAAEQKQKDGTATDKSNKAVPDVDVVTTTSHADTGEDADAAASSAAPESVSAPATAPCRNNAACSDAGAEECIPPHGLFGLRRTFFSKKVY